MKRLQNLWSNSKKKKKKDTAHLYTLVDLLYYVSEEHFNEWLRKKLEFIIGMNQMYYRNSYVFIIGTSE